MVLTEIFFSYFADNMQVIQRFKQGFFMLYSVDYRYCEKLDLLIPELVNSPQMREIEIDFSKATLDELIQINSTIGKSVLNSKLNTV